MGPKRKTAKTQRNSKIYNTSTDLFSRIGDRNAAVTITAHDLQRMKIMCVYSGGIMNLVRQSELLIQFQRSYLFLLPLYL